jgi:hypothetical protein
MHALVNTSIKGGPLYVPFEGHQVYEADGSTSYKGQTEHPGAYIPTRFASLPTLSWCSLQTCSDFPLYGVVGYR